MNGPVAMNNVSLDVRNMQEVVSRAKEAVALKCHLLTDGIRIEQGSFDTSKVNLTRRHLYDYGTSVPEHEVPYEIILHWVDVATKRLPIVARVRYNKESPWHLVRDGSEQLVINSVTGDRSAVKIREVADFRGQSIMGQPLDSLVQRLGYDLLGLVPTNYCAFYRSGGKCAFCEIVETHDDLIGRTAPYRRSLELLTAASVAAAEQDESVTSITFNGGQLNGLDETVRMYVRLLEMISNHSATESLDKTIACMPPEDWSLIEDLAGAGLNQFFINVETMDEQVLQYMAPKKSEIGLPRMFEGLERSINAFGVGRVYSNLVYGIQTIGSKWPAKWLRASDENAAMLQQAKELLDRRVVPTFTVYHSSGRNSTGPIRLSGDGLFRFTIEYGELVRDSGYIDPARGAVLFSIGSLPNTTYNDGWLLADMATRFHSIESGG
ncbi:MAG: radical SAM protein [Propionibacteriaceae bacterium]|nr:radical SAM protein [Propionibacteriaceae bacterium]